MKKIRKYLIAVAVIISLAFTVRAEIIYYDYSDAPKSISITASGLSLSESGSLFLSTNGTSECGGKLEIRLSAIAEKRCKVHAATVELGNGFAQASANDAVNADTVFNSALTALISETDRKSTASYDDYLAFLFDAGGNNFFYGWMEVYATADIPPNGKQSTVSFSIKHLAFNNVANESIAVGAIPEPAMVTLVLGFGAALLAARRIFNKGL